jgi:excinuclease UvrABC nuclease subunit
VPGVYVFLKPSVTRPGYWDFLYVGQAANLKDRLQNHERWPSAMLRGCTAIAALPVWNAIERDALERDMIQSLCPLMNSHHNGLRSLLG